MLVPTMLMFGMTNLPSRLGGFSSHPAEPCVQTPHDVMSFTEMAIFGTGEFECALSHLGGPDVGQE